MEWAVGSEGALINGLDAAIDLLAPHFADICDERLIVAHLDVERRLIALQVRSAADRRSVRFPMRQIIADAMSMHGAAVILAHNHPSGDPEPTPTDMDITRELIRVARPLDLAVRDHIVFAGERYVSFRQRGLL